MTPGKKDKYLLVLHAHTGTTDCVNVFTTPVFLNGSDFYTQVIGDDRRITGFTKVAVSGRVFPPIRRVNVAIGDQAIYSSYLSDGVCVQGSYEKIVADEDSLAVRKMMANRLSKL